MAYFARTYDHNLGTRVAPLTSDQLQGLCRRGLYRRLIVQVSVVLFLVIAWLTLPKIVPRMSGLLLRAEARHIAWRNKVEKQTGVPAPAIEGTAVSGQELLLVLGVAAGGGIVLLGLGYFALRPSKKQQVHPDLSPTLKEPPP